MTRLLPPHRFRGTRARGKPDGFQATRDGPTLGLVSTPPSTPLEGVCVPALPSLFKRKRLMSVCATWCRLDSSEVRTNNEHDFGDVFQVEKALVSVEQSGSAPIQGG